MVQSVSNGLLLELLKFKNLHSQCTFKVFFSWLKDLYGETWPHEAAPTPKAATKSVRRLMVIYQNLKKRDICAVAEFLEREYELPKVK